MDFSIFCEKSGSKTKATQLDTKFKCLFTAFFNCHQENWSKYKKQTNEKQTRERWRLISLSFAKTMWDLLGTDSRKRDVLYTALMPLKWEITQIWRHLSHACTIATSDCTQKGITTFEITHQPTDWQTVQPENYFGRHQKSSSTMNRPALDIASNFNWISAD